MKNLLSYEEYLTKMVKFLDLSEKKENPSSEKKRTIPEGHIQHFLEEFTQL